MTVAQSTAIVVERRGSMYDPAVVDAFLALLPTLRSESHDEPGLQRAITRIRDAAAQEPAAMAPRPVVAQAPLATGSVVDSLVRVVSAPPRVADLARLVTPELRALASGAEFVFFLSETSGQRVVGRVTTGATLHGAHGLQIALGERVSGWVAANLQQALNSDARLDLGPVASHAGAQYCLATPLLADDKLVGVLTGYSAEAFSEDAARHLATLAPRLAEALIRAADINEPTARPARTALRAVRADLRVASSR
jgi:GAF domain-containing protein